MGAGALNLWTDPMEQEGTRAGGCSWDADLHSSVGGDGAPACVSTQVIIHDGASVVISHLILYGLWSTEGLVKISAGPLSRHRCVLDRSGENAGFSIL
jgi:hypothetical protein